MDQTRWLRHVEHSLLKSGLPARYVNRTCLELSDHVEACRDAGGEVTLLREQPKELSAQLVQGYRKQGLWRRIPPVLLLLLPFPIAALMILAYYQLCYVLLLLLFDPIEEMGELPLHVVVTLWAFFYGGKLAGPLLSGLAMRGITRRMSRPWGWAATLFVLQCFATILTKSSLELAHSTVELSIIVDSDLAHWMGTAQLLSGLALAVFGSCVVARMRVEQLREVV